MFSSKYAGKHLKELQKKVQSFDFGTILNESKKRLGSKIGIQNVPALNVPSQLQGSAQLASKSVVEFGQAIERVLVKYGRKITGKIYELKTKDLIVIITFHHSRRAVRSKSNSTSHN
jgi:hypothetical protein